jgi:hypothetical protein
MTDSCTNCKPNLDSKQYMKANESLVEENYNFIEKHFFLKSCKLMVNNLMAQGWVYILCGWGREHVLQLGRIHLSIGA